MCIFQKTLQVINFEYFINNSTNCWCIHFIKHIFLCFMQFQNILIGVILCCCFFERLFFPFDFKLNRKIMTPTDDVTWPKQRFKTCTIRAYLHTFIQRNPLNTLSNLTQCRLI